MAETAFLKYHALGNDYLCLERETELAAALVRALCDRHRGVGADGVVTVGAVREGRARARLYNADGSVAERSGNGLRIAACALSDLGQAPSGRLELQVDGALVEVRWPQTAARWGDRSVRIDLGTPALGARAVGLKESMAASAGLCLEDAPTPAVGPSEPRWRYTPAARPQEAGALPLAVAWVSMGNPHGALFLPGAPSAPALPLSALQAQLAAWAPQLQAAPCFAHGINLQLVQPLGPRCLQLAIWERGSGPTLASGTSATAAVAGAQALQLCHLEAAIDVRMPGGTVEVSRSAQGSLLLQGPVAFVARGHAVVPQN